MKDKKIKAKSNRVSIDARNFMLAKPIELINLRKY